MNIKNQLFLIIICIVGATIVAIFSINASIQNYRTAIIKTADASKIVTEVFEKRLLVDDYILYSGDRAKDQWYIKNENLKRIIKINKDSLETTEEKRLFSIIEDTSNHGQSVFDQLVNRQETGSTTNSALDESNLRLGRQLSASAQETISAAQMLYTYYNKEADKALQQIIIVFTSASTLFFLMLLGSCAIIWNITSNLDDEKAIDEAILASVGDGLVALNQHGTVTLLNKAVEQLIGWKTEELIGTTWTKMIPIVNENGETVPNDLRPLNMVLTKGKSIGTTKYSYIKKNKQKIPVAITVSPIISDGKHIGAIEVFRDITHERDVDRMKTEFISLASHQLRTPLTAIKWFLELLLNEDVGSLKPEQKRMIKNIDKSNERMIQLVNALLNVSRIESGRIIIDPLPTDLEQLLQEVHTDLQAKIKEKNHHLKISVNPQLPAVTIDPKLIRQVYLNLLSNAIKYTPNNGKISVSITQKGNQIITQVKDNGYGIPAKDHNRVFDKFYRGENIIKYATDGNGLGMYLVKSIIESSQGKIWFESEEGKGTTFWFSIPVTGMQAKKGEIVLDEVVM